MRVLQYASHNLASKSVQCLHMLALQTDVRLECCFHQQGDAHRIFSHVQLSLPSTTHMAHSLAGIGCNSRKLALTASKGCFSEWQRRRAHVKAKICASTHNAASELCNDFRNIDKAGGLDAYLWKIQGGKEDTQMAEKLRARLQHVQLRRLAASQSQHKSQHKNSLLPPAAAVAVAEQGAQ